MGAPPVKHHFGMVLTEHKPFGYTSKVVPASGVTLSRVTRKDMVQSRRVLARRDQSAGGAPPAGRANPSRFV